MAKPYKRKDSRFYWIAPWIEGRQVHQSSGETDYERAERKLKILEGKLAANAPIKAKTDRGTFAFLLETVRTDYKVKRRRSLYDLEKRIDTHLIPMLGHLPTGKIGAMIPEYILERQQAVDADGNPAPAANATINRELAIIKRAFRLGERIGLVSAIPYIEMLPEDNARQGFFVEEHFRSVLHHANSLLRDVLIVCYYTGWRIESVLGLEWRQVDLKAGAIRLFSQQTKNRKATIFPLAPFPELRAAFETRLKERTGLIPYVFHRDGRPVKSIRKAWELTRIRAGVPGRLIHDLRRTAVRNLKAQGWSDTDIMNMVGLRTLSMLIRYNITTEDDILNKGAEMAKRLESRRG